jgi:hypothetical protein
MTLKGKKNHYNVKLLRGYGCSIRLKDNKVVLRDGTDVFTGKAEVEEWICKRNSREMPEELYSFLCSSSWSLRNLSWSLWPNSSNI